MPTDFEATEREPEDRLASVSESGVSLVNKERLSELKAQLDEERHLLEQERAIHTRTRAAFDKERADLDEKAETLAIENERLRERVRELDQRESALRQREAQVAKRINEPTNPHLDEPTGGASDWEPRAGAAQEWNLPTVAASIEEARAMVTNPPRREPRRESVKQAPPRPTSPLRALMNANPVATFAFGFAVATLAMMILWSVLL